MSIKKIFNNLKKYRYKNEDININELQEIIKMNPDSVLLDVRSPQEFNEGHLNRCN